MKNEEDGRDKVKYIAANLFILLLYVYLLTAPAYIYEFDASQLRMAVVKSLFDRFDLSVPSNVGIQGFDGRSYSWFGIGPVLMTVPFYLIGQISGLSPANLFYLFNLVIGVATAVLVFLFINKLGYSLRSSFLASIFYGLGTMAWYYAKDPGDHAIETFLVLLTIYFGHRFSEENNLSDLLLSALSLGLALLTRPTSLLVIPPFIFLLLHNDFDKKDIKKSLALAAKRIAMFFVILLPFAGLNLWYNYYRFGSVFETGYGLIAARLGLDYFGGTKFMTGLGGLLLSPGKGFFYYSPIAILFFFSIKLFSQKHPRTAISFLIIILSYVAFYSKYIFWHGCNDWGPRLIFVITPYLIIPTAALLDSIHWIKRKLNRVIVYTLFFVSISVQIAAVSVNPFKYNMYLQMEKGVEFTVAKGAGAQPIFSPPVEIFFDWRQSPIVAQFKFMYEIFVGMRSYKYTSSTKDITSFEDVKSAPRMNLFDFWWVYKYFSEGSKTGIMIAIILVFAAMHYFRKIYKKTIY